MTAAPPPIAPPTPPSASSSKASASPWHDMAAAKESATAMMAAAQKALAAAEAALEAVTADSQSSKLSRTKVEDAVEESRSMLKVAESWHIRLHCNSPSMRFRQPFAEFAAALSEEVKEVAEEALDEAQVYVERNIRRAKSLIEDHFHIDEAFRLLGPLHQDDNRARDVHDWFNLVALLPVIWMNFANWRCSSGSKFCGLFAMSLGLGDQAVSVTDLWQGDSFVSFWWTTFTYFILDLIWMVVLPNCVRSPGVIIKHHLATIAYIMIPYTYPEYGWLMGACMIVEVNTWFLIARRAFNTQGDKPFCTGVSLPKSLRLCLISSCFYVSWFSIRLVVYPCLFVVIVQEWWKFSQKVGTPLNPIALTPLIQAVLIFLNIKWTIDLVRSKFKKKGPAKGL
eukprot:TRINITY_DN27700_c0_g4_i1.p1 TRINITY_DN27700_c0_g4~~TRINITY_DN27700_c0_g4_i1.p1  ORF type:complete len:396 (+),score=84.15 TRINITY_DN27700_c0_g4_i1:132-1319(+)